MSYTLATTMQIAGYFNGVENFHAYAGRFQTTFRRLRHFKETPDRTHVIIAQANFANRRHYLVYPSHDFALLMANHMTSRAACKATA